MRRGGWREHVRAELRAREGRWRGLRRLLERHEQLQERLEAQLPVGGASGPRADPAALPVQLRREEGESHQQVALQAELLRSAEAESREQRARLGCLARDLAALTRRHQEAECRAWRFARENEELRTELGQARALLQEAQAGRLAVEARWLREKALEATRVNRAIEQEEKYRRKVTRLQEKLGQARGQAGLPGVDSDERGGGSLSASSEEAEAVVGKAGQGPVWGGRPALPSCRGVCGIFGAWERKVRVWKEEGCFSARWLEPEGSLRWSPTPIQITFPGKAGLRLEEGQLLGAT